MKGDECVSESITSGSLSSFFSPLLSNQPSAVENNLMPASVPN